jgi:tetratricopeptide (TPR) repeat protein
MNDNLEYIDQYFAGLLPPGTSKEFERKILEDPQFAEEVAFYVSARQVSREEVASLQKKRFLEMYTRHKEDKKPRVIRALWPYAAAAAAVVGILICWYLFMKPVGVEQLAQEYIDRNFTTLGVTMGSREDEQQKGLALYNEGQLTSALAQFQKMITLDSTDFTAIKYAGITSLRLKQYDKAVHYFELLKDQTDLYANPGTLLLATTLLKRDQAGDKKAARTLLEEVVQKDLEGKEVAVQWLKKW